MLNLSLFFCYFANYLRFIMRKYKLLALDLDGTLTKNDKTISEHTRHTLIRAQEQGLKIILASGRPTYGVAPLADELRMAEFGGYILSFNGGQIYDWSTKELLYSNELPKDVLPYLYECSKRRDGFTILSYCGKQIVTEAPEYPYVMHASFLNKMPIRHVQSFLDEVTYPLPKCLIVGEPEPLHALELEMAEHLKGKIGVFRSEPFFLELVPKDIDKAKCLSILLSKIGVAREDLIACGDGFNDLTMIEYAGLGVAMANAQSVVKSKADYVTLSNEEDGVAAVVDKFFFGQQ